MEGAREISRVLISTGGGGGFFNEFLLPFLASAVSPQLAKRGRTPKPPLILIGKAGGVACCIFKCVVSSFAGISTRLLFPKENYGSRPENSFEWLYFPYPPCFPNRYKKSRI